MDQIVLGTKVKMLVRSFHKYEYLLESDNSLITVSRFLRGFEIYHNSRGLIETLLLVLYQQNCKCIEKLLYELQRLFQ